MIVTGCAAGVTVSVDEQLPVPPEPTTVSMRVYVPGLRSLKIASVTLPLVVVAYGPKIVLPELSLMMYESEVAFCELQVAVKGPLPYVIVEGEYETLQVGTDTEPAAVTV